MWIVRLALSRPYTFVVLSLLILILSPFVILRTPIDLFPNIDIPVVAVGWTYTGLNVEEMEGRLTTVYERALTTLVDNIQHIESTTYDGLVVVKIYLQPNASIDTANAQVTAATKAQEAAVPFVDVVTPRPNAPDQDLVLPGNTLAYSDTPIYARTSGYLKRWYFGIGAQVHQGDLPALGSTRDTTMTETAHCTCGRSASPRVAEVVNIWCEFPRRGGYDYSNPIYTAVDQFVTIATIQVASGLAALTVPVLMRT